MAYATVDLAVELYGEEYVTVSCDRDGDGVLDEADFETALDDASDWIDSFLFGKYTLPLSDVPRWLARVCVDVAIYNSCPTADVLTIEKKERYENACTTMKAVAKGERRLPKDGVNTTSRNRPASAVIVIAKDQHDEQEYGARTWTRKRSRGVL